MAPGSTFERSLYLANVLGGFYFGLQTYMCFHSMHLLRQRQGIRPQMINFYIIYGFAMLLLSMCAWMGNALVGQLMWIDHRDYPGGPLAYYYAESTSWFSVLSTAAPVIQNFMNDALLLYRCFIIWNHNRLVVLFPSLIFIASTVLSIISLIQSAVPNANFFQKSTTNFSVPWISLSSGFNIIITCLIGGRILYIGHKYGRVLSQATGRSTVPYTGVVAVIVESALPLSITGIILSVFLSKGLPSAIFVAVTCQAFIALAPQLIILRVAVGRAWERDTLMEIPMTPIGFANSGSSDIMRDVGTPVDKRSNSDADLS